MEFDVIKCDMKSDKKNDTSLNFSDIKQSCIRAQCDILKIHENYDDIQYQNLLFKLFLAREKFAFLITEKNFTFFMRTCITFPKIG